jgi:capsule polysaccharide export protein KpsE/RkpR
VAQGTSAPVLLRLDLPALARAMWVRRVRLLMWWGAVAVLAAGVVFALPRWWSASVTLVPAPQEGLSLDLSGMGLPVAGGSLNIGTGPTPQDELKMVVLSRAVADSLVDRFDLVRRYHVKHRRDAREALAEHTTVTTPREGQVIVEIEAQGPALARDMAAAYATIAGTEAVRLKTSLATERRAYLERRLAALSNEIAQAADHVRRFEESHGAYALPDQAKETMDAAGQLQAQAALLETELAGARRFFTDQSAEVQGLRDRIGALHTQIDKLARQGGTLMVRGAALPALKEEYLSLTREQASLTAVSELLRRFYEQARVEESNPVPTFSVLDAAELPERHARPRRGLTIAVAVALAVAGSLGFVQWQLATAAGQPAPRVPEQDREAA